MTPTARNIIYIVCHDLGRQLGCYGAATPSPVLDAFAREGMRLDRAFCSSPCCSPSRCCAYTGRHAHASGMMGLANPGGWSLAPEVPTVVDWFNERGVATVHVGLQHERQRAADNRYRHELCTVDHATWRDCRDEFAEEAVDAAIAWLRERGHDRRFYLNLGTIEVHETRWMDEVADAPLQQRSCVYGRADPGSLALPPGLPDTPEQRARIARFHGAVGFLDRQLARLFAALRELRLAEDTLVVFTTDHGMVAPRGKGWLYAPGVEIAFLARLPGVIAPQACSQALIQNIDVAPTLLEAAGLAAPAGIQGRSFWPLLAGLLYRPHERIVIERNWHDDDCPMRSLRTPRWHYLRNWGPRRPDPWHATPDPLRAEELYDSAADPLERADLANHPACAPVLSELRAGLDRWMAEQDDPVRRRPWPPAASGAGAGVPPYS